MYEFKASLILQPFCFAMKLLSTCLLLRLQKLYSGFDNHPSRSGMCLGPAPTGPNVGATGCYPADSQGWQMEAGIKHGQSENKITEQYGVHREDGG